jgi:hypothetical protein
MHKLCGGQVQCQYRCDELLFLFGRNLPCLDWVKRMHCMFCRIILRGCGAIRSDWQLCCWVLFSLVSDSLLVLPRRHLHFNCIFVKLFDMSRWVILDCDFIKLHKLCRVDLSGLFRLKFMYTLSGGVVLRDDGFIFRDCSVCIRQIRVRGLDGLLNLHGWQLLFVVCFELFKL